MKKHNFFHNVLTFFYLLIKGLLSSLIWLLLGVAGYLLFQTKKTPYDLIIGLPLMLAGAGFLINNLWTLLLSIFSPNYLREMCPLCKKN
jgi:hypothetical protein